MAQLVGHRPIKQPFPGQGTCLGYGFSTKSGCIQEVTNQMFLSLSFSLPSPLPKNAINKILKKFKKWHEEEGTQTRMELKTLTTLPNHKTWPPSLQPLPTTAFRSLWLTSVSAVTGRVPLMGWAWICVPANSPKLPPPSKPPSLPPNPDQVSKPHCGVRTASVLPLHS